MKSRAELSVDCPRSSSSLQMVCDISSSTCSIHGFVGTRLDYFTASLSGPDRAVLQIYTQHFFFSKQEAVREQNIHQTAVLSEEKHLGLGFFFFYSFLLFFFPVSFQLLKL